MMHSNIRAQRPIILRVSLGKDRRRQDCNWKTVAQWVQRQMPGRRRQVPEHLERRSWEVIT